MPLRRKSWEVLCYLAERPGRLITKSELLDAVWPETSVTEKVVAISIREIRQALGDDARNPRFVETAHGRGFRLLVRFDDERPVKHHVSVPEGGAPLVGREAELQAIETALDAARSGSGQIVGLSGEAGIGKSRLAREAAVLAEARGGRSLVGHCYEGGGTPALWPWVEILNAYTEASGTDELIAALGSAGVDLVELLPHLRTVFPAAPTQAPADVEWARSRLFTSIVRLLGAAADSRPLFLVIDDAQWADASSLQLLRVVAQRSATLSLCVLVAFRDIERPGILTPADLLADVARDMPVRTLKLSGLSASDVAKMVRPGAGAGLPQSTLDILFEQTSGNPFFVEELVKYWAEIGLVDGEQGLTSQLVGASLPLAPSVQDAVRRRVDRLDGAFRPLLELAAVAGTEFDAVALAAACGDSMEEVLVALERAQRAGLLYEIPSRRDCFTFRHALVREVLYGDLGDARRRRMHIRMGQAMETVCAADLTLKLGEIALHFLEGADAQHQSVVSKAVSYAAGAAGLAIGVYAFDEAASWFDKALQAHALLEHPDELAQCRMQLARADVLLYGHRMEESKKQFELAAVLARKLHAAPELALAVLGKTVWDLQPQRASAEDVAWVEESLVLLGDTEVALQARLLSRLATLQTWLDEPITKRLEISDRALGLGRDCIDDYAHAHVLVDRLWTLWDPAYLDERTRVAEECVSASRAAGSKVLEAFAHGWEMVNFLGRGDFDAIDAVLRDHGDLVDEIGQPGFRWGTALYRATRATVFGDFAAAERLTQAAYEVGAVMSPVLSASGMAMQLLAIRREQGRMAEMSWLVGMASDSEHAPYLHWVVPFLHFEMGEIDAARTELERLASHGFEDLPVHDQGLGGFSYSVLLADTCASLGDRVCADLLYDRLLPYADQWVVTSVLVNCFGVTARCLGRLAATAGRWQQAETHFVAATDAHRCRGTLPLLARTQVDHAEMLQLRGRQQARVRSILDEAEPHVIAMGMTSQLARIASLR